MEEAALRDSRPVAQATEEASMTQQDEALLEEEMERLLEENDYLKVGGENIPISSTAFALLVYNVIKQ